MPYDLITVLSICLDLLDPIDEVQGGVLNRYIVEARGALRCARGHHSMLPDDVLNKLQEVEQPCPST